MHGLSQHRADHGIGHALELHHPDATAPATRRTSSSSWRPRFAVEVKLAETRVDPAMVYFRDRLSIPWVYQVTLEGDKDFVEDGVRVLPADVFLSALA